jgi:hypothetical protein
LPFYSAVVPFGGVHVDYTEFCKEVLASEFRSFKLTACGCAVLQRTYAKAEDHAGLCEWTTINK